jgi:hypothetical protein
MNKKMLFMGVIAIVLLFMSASNVFARSLVADLGDVRIYSLGDGYYVVESDRVQQSIPLQFTERAGLIEVARASSTQRVATNGIGKAVEYVVTAYLGWSSDLAPLLVKLLHGQLDKV